MFSSFMQLLYPVPPLAAAIFQTKTSNDAAADGDNNASAPVQRTPTPDEWRDWLRENGRRYLLYARQQTRADADAEDVLQDALVESWRRSNGVPEHALVFATIRRRAIDFARSCDRRAAREGDHQPEALTFQQIAEVTEVPLNTAASRYRYALEELRQTLKGALS